MTVATALATSSIAVRMAWKRLTLPIVPQACSRTRPRRRPSCGDGREGRHMTSRPIYCLRLRPDPDVDAVRVALCAQDLAEALRHEGRIGGRRSNHEISGCKRRRATPEPITRANRRMTMAFEQRE